MTPSKEKPLRRFAPVLLLLTACTSSDNSIPSAHVEESTSSSAPTTTEASTTTIEVTITTEAPSTTAVTSVELPILCPGLRHPAHHYPCPVDTTAAPRRTPATTAASTASVQGAPPDYIAQCESGGDPRAVNPNGHYGKWQFSQSTWESVGGTGRPDQASEVEQDKRAAILWNGGKGASHWECA